MAHNSIARVVSRKDQQSAHSQKGQPMQQYSLFVLSTLALGLWHTGGAVDSGIHVNPGTSNGSYHEPTCEYHQYALTLKAVARITGECAYH